MSPSERRKTPATWDTSLRGGSSRTNWRHSLVATNSAVRLWPAVMAARAALRSGADYFDGFVRDYRARRDLLCGALTEIGFALTPPSGTYFVMADHSAFGFADDVAFCKHLAAEIGVAAIPPSAFYEDADLGKPLVRFAFCKEIATLEAAIDRLRALGR